MHIKLTVKLDAKMFNDWNWTNADAIKSQNSIQCVNFTEIGIGLHGFKFIFSFLWRISVLYADNELFQFQFPLWSYLVTAY